MRIMARAPVIAAALITSGSVAAPARELAQVQVRVVLQSAPGSPYGSRCHREAAVMIYVLAFFLPPLALLLNGQIFSAILNVALLVFCLVFGLVFHVLLLVPSAHAIIAIYMKREDRKHREVVESIERHGAPPNRRP
jgi:uncharacterized membrane protein YqaE (UPF0057 family)